ncbi:hypothetical protein FACS1894147_11210 [Spirochaetia bacterium]|nr:hypothetical protein FACS1894147_11210 [Spirochaetia bacterium]
MACTHYPAVSPLIQNLYPGIELIDPGKALFDECMKRLEPDQAAQGVVKYYTTGDAELSEDSAEKAFGFSDLAFQKIPLVLRL